jgi:hypothetical protein
VGAVAWSDELLAELRAQADLDADDLVGRFYASHPDIGDPSHLVRRMVRSLRLNDDGETPNPFADYFSNRDALPDWTDRAVVRAGQEFFEDRSAEIGNALFCASLPEAYGAAHGVHVLAITADLVTDTRRRIAETGQFLLDALTVGALEPGERGYRAARGVRLMHAAVRYMVLHDRKVQRDDDPGVQQLDCATFVPRWSSAWGAPVNQEDLLGTLLTFTWRVFASLEVVGDGASTEDKEAYLHTWSVIAHLLGMRPDLLPLHVEDVEILHPLLRRRLQGESCAGRVLTKALVDTLHVTMPGPAALPECQIRAFIGDEAADRLGVPRAGWPARLFGPLRTMHRLERLTGLPVLTRRLARGMHRRVWERFIAEGRGDRPQFDVPSYVMRPWRQRRAVRRARRKGSVQRPRRRLLPR